MSKNSLPVLLLRVALGLFFLYVGGEKLFRLDDFTRDVANYQFGFLAPPMDAIVAYTLPWLEVLCGLTLVVGCCGVRAALGLIAGMLVVFIAGLASAWSRGLEISCGCFGHSDHPTNYPIHITLNVVLLVLTVILFFLSPGKKEKRLFGKRRLTLPS